MKRTITLRVEVADPDEYARAVEAIVFQNSNYVAEAQWTRGEEIRPILDSMGHNTSWSSAKVGS